MNKKLFKSKLGIKLDIGCGDAKQANFVGMDRRKLPGVDIVHDAQVFPYPIPKDSCFQILLSHLWEHIEPKYRIDLMDELWRIMKDKGQLMIASPYYQSLGALQDPTHYGCPTEATFSYFDPSYPLYQIYKPKPWHLAQNTYQYGGSVNVILEAIKSK